MKTVEIQNQITATKGLIRAWHEDPSAENWSDVANALNILVETTYRTMPPPVEIREVQVSRDVPMVQQLSVETVREVVKEVLVEKPVEITKEIPVVREVIKEVRVEIPVPVFNHQEG